MKPLKRKERTHKPAAQGEGGPVWFFINWRKNVPHRHRANSTLRPSIPPWAGLRLKRAWLPRLVVVCLWALPAFSQTQEYQIVSVEVQGNRVADRSLIQNVAGLAIGSRLDAGGVADAIRRIYGLNLFSDVAIEGDLQGNNGIALVIQVQEYPKIRRIDIAGNKKVKTEEIRTKLTLREGQTASPVAVQENVNRIRSLCEEKGYYLAAVESKSATEGSADEVVLSFRINEGEKVKLEFIEFAGASAYPPDKLRGKIHGGGFKAERYEQDKEKLIEFYQKNGYTDAAILGDTTWVDSTRRFMHALITLGEGKRFHFGQVAFSGDSLFGQQRLASQVKFKPGEIFNQKKYDQTLGNLYALYQEEGYLYARIEDRKEPQDSLVNLTYEITQGIPAKINRVIIEGNQKTKDKVIRRELSVRPGQTFRRSLLLRSVRDVMQLNYFANVTPDYAVQPTGDIDLVIKVEEKPTGQIQVGAGYSGQDKLVGTIGLGIPNLFGNGQRLDLNLDFGNRRNSVSLGFTEPWFRDTPTSVGFDLFHLNRRFFEDFTEGRTGFSLRVGRRLRWPDNYFRLFGNYRLESLNYHDFSDDYRSRTQSNPSSLVNTDWPKVTSSAGLTLSRDSRDLPQFATSGAVFSWSSEYAGGPLGGYFQYHKHIFEASKFQKLVWKFVLAGKARVGWVDNPKGEQKVPFIEKFSPGGVDPDGVIRGYVDRSIGPYDSQGFVQGGRSVLTYNLELQFPIVPQQIYGLFLADAGNAWASGREVTPFAHLFKSAGFGIRLTVPGIGLIGFDFAYGFDQSRFVQGRRWRPHFQVGTTF